MAESTSNSNGRALVWRWIGLIQHGILRVFGLILILLFALAIPGFIGVLMVGSDRFEVADSGVLKFAPDGVIVEEKGRFSPDEALTGALLGGERLNQILL